jgi:hypothetical protein
MKRLLTVAALMGALALGGSALAGSASAASHPSAPHHPVQLFVGAWPPLGYYHISWD